MLKETRPVQRLPIVLALLALAQPSAAQHALGGTGSYDPRVPAPRAVLGYELGERFTPHHMLMRYLEAVAATSGRIRLDTVAHTFEGREVMLATLTSEANHARLDQIRADAQRLAHPGPVAPAELSAAIARTPVIVWLGYTVHGSEASGTEAAIAMIYQLAAGQDAETRTILDSALVLVDPLQNPDGHERHVQDVMRMRTAFGVPTHPSAMIHSGNWPGPRTSHYFFDLNRDWFIHSHPETRGRVATFNRWSPHVAVDLHEMGSNSTYFFAPPMEPVNLNVHGTIHEWWDIFAASNAAAFDRHGWSFFRREGYDEFYPGYGVSWPILSGAVGMTYEQASSAAGAIRRNDGTILTLRQAALQHHTAAWATALTSARLRTKRLRDFVTFRQTAVTDAGRAPLRSVLIERDDQGRADSLVSLLQRNGIVVHRLRDAATVNATEYGSTQARSVRVPAGAFVVDVAQPQGRLATAILEPEAQLDSSFIAEELERRRTAQPGRFYDLTAWALPLTYRVRSWWTRSTVGPLEQVTEAGLRREPPTPARGSYGYAFTPGSESSMRLLASLLADTVRVWFAPRSFTAAGGDFPNGAFVVRTQANDEAMHGKLQRAAREAGARVVALYSAMADRGTDLGSNSVFPIRQPRIALLGGAPINGNSFGFAWFAFDQRLRFPVTPIAVGSVTGAALDDFNVLVVPHTSAAALERELGDGGRQRLAAWVRSGGTLVTIDGATMWLADERLGLARLRARRDTAATDGGAPLPASVPGAIVRAFGDTLSPLMAGVNQRELPVLVFSDRFYTAPRDVRAGEAVISYADEPRLRISGYLWPEVPARIAGTPYLWTERVGRGRVIGFAGDPNFRDLWRGMLPLFANAVFLGPSF
jgi:hypothetical protein